jgi:ABC-type multidrug transport system permease subunit
MFTWLVFGVNWGNPFWLAIVLTSCNLAFTGVVAMIYSLTKTLNAANAFATSLILTFSIVGGSMMPFEEMPATMQTIGSFTVNRQGIMAIHALMDNSDFTIWLYASLRMFIIGIVLICFASFRIYKRITAGEML